MILMFYFGHLSCVPCLESSAETALERRREGAAYLHSSRVMRRLSQPLFTAPSLGCD